MPERRLASNSLIILEAGVESTFSEPFELLLELSELSRPVVVNLSPQPDKSATAVIDKMSSCFFTIPPIVLTSSGYFRRFKFQKND
ncbi:hypothetical protein D3C87_1971170 [compost metagenome]